MTTQQSLEQLASGALPTLGGDSMQPSWSRSLHELAAANKSFLGNNPQQPTASAQLLLGDRTDFGSLVASLESSSPKTTTLTQDAFQSLDASRRKQRDSAIERILQRERENTNRQLERQLEQQLEDDWKREREWWLKELVGSRNLVDASNSLGIRRADRQLEATFQSVSGPSHMLALGGGASSLPLDPVAVQRHLQLLRSITATTNLQSVIEGYQKMTTSDATGYAIAWQLFGNMIPNLSSPFHGALGSLLHFCKQYQDVIKNRVASANLAGQNVVTDRNYGTGMGGTMATYVKLEYGADASTWHILYFCLRCGDFSAAKSVLDVARANHDHFPEQDVIQNVVYQNAQRQAHASCIWENGTPTVSPNDRATIVDLHNKAQNLEGKNIFKIGVLALLSGQNLPDGSYNTIEDYLFGHLWLALQQEDPTSQITLIGKSIKKYGPEYFEADRNGAWVYALPLLASQQFKTALVYLAEAGSAGLLQATHLGLVLASKGLRIIDLGEQESSSPCLLTALLIKYASLLEADSHSGPAAALEYLLKIPKKEKSRHEIASLIVRQAHLVDHFGGILTEEGGRKNALLDKYMSRDEASLILAESADMFKRQHHDRNKAELAAKSFMLSGRYGALLVLLNDLISPTDDASPEKLHWSQQSQMFHETYLRSRTLVVESLEREGNLGLIQVNEQLTAMRRFFENVRGGRFQEAFQTVSSLNLLPLSQDQMNERESRYKGLNQSIQAAMPSLICGTMECLFGMYNKIKSESRGIKTTVEVRLRELSMMARFIYVFAGLVNMPSSTKDFISQKRNLML